MCADNADSAAIELSLMASAGHRCAGIGEQLNICGDPAVIRADVRGEPSGIVSFHTDRGTVHKAPLPDNGSGAVAWRTSAAESVFVLKEITALSMILGITAGVAIYHAIQNSSTSSTSQDVTGVGG